MIGISVFADDRSEWLSYIGAGANAEGLKAAMVAQDREVKASPKDVPAQGAEGTGPAVRTDKFVVYSTATPDRSASKQNDSLPPGFPASDQVLAKQPTTDGSKETNLPSDDRITQFEKEHGIVVHGQRAHDDKPAIFSYHLVVNGRDMVLPFTTAATEDGLIEAQAKLKEIVQDLEERTTKTYQVDFSSENDTVQRRIPNPQAVQDDLIQCRRPNIQELLAIASALKNDPYYRQQLDASKAVKFYFLEKPFDDGAMASAATCRDAKGRPAIFLNPIWNNGVITVRDAFSQSRPTTWMQAVVAHELEHADLGQFGAYAIREQLQIPVDSAEQTVRRDYENLGWKLIPEEGGTGYGYWAIVGTDGRYYRHSDSQMDDHWMQIDEKGERVGQSLLRSDEVQKLARIPPAYSYFPAPREVLAESLAIYRSGAEAQQLLSPQLFAVCLQIDREEINRYAPPINGKPQLIRNAQGDLAPN